ncbi:MAG: 3-isopropylmalate dehydratase small subunit [Bacteroidota bacterium]|jgi:3-isopropylmalate/(R)-2-methylmalate dehydratase small subunit
MEKIVKIESRAVPIPIQDIDTDQIIPARFLKATDKVGFGDNLFRDWRYDKNNQPVTDFVLNSDTYSGEVLVAGRNFGCGSSREHAAWAIAGYGFKVVISSFFADIFKNNALNNGILPLRIEEDFLQEILATVQSEPQSKLVIDLPTQTLTFLPTGRSATFEINSYKKECLINGYDDIDYLLSMRTEIEQFETSK